MLRPLNLALRQLPRPVALATTVQANHGAVNDSTGL